jgi:hypothetical protein
MFKHGIGIEAAPSMWIMIPILTLVGITMFRITMGLHHNFGQHLDKASLFTLTVIIVSFQALFGILGYSILKKLDYFNIYVHGDKKSPVSFALICPGVAFMVFGVFLVQYGFISNHIIEKYSIAHLIALSPFIYVQYKTISYFFKLKNKFEL